MEVILWNFHSIFNFLPFSAIFAYFDHFWTPLEANCNSWGPPGPPTWIPNAITTQVPPNSLGPAPWAKKWLIRNTPPYPCFNHCLHMTRHQFLKPSEIVSGDSTQTPIADLHDFGFGSCLRNLLFICDQPFLIRLRSEPMMRNNETLFILVLCK